VKVSTDDVLGRADERKGFDRVLSRAAERPSSPLPSAVVVGALVATTSSLTALGLFYWRGPGDAWVTPFAAFLALALAGVVIAAMGIGLVARAAPGGVSELPYLLIRFWRGSANGWTMFLVGCALTLPAFAFFTPALTGDADSARIVASVLYVQHNGVDYLVDTQEVLLPHVLMGPVLAIGGIPGVQLLTALSVVVLGGVVAFIAWRLTRAPLAVVASVLALSSLPAILERTYRLPMYPAMLAFGFLGVYLAHRAIIEESRSRRWLNAVLSGLCLVLAFEAHQVGQLFLVITALLVVTGRPSSTLPGLGRVYLVVAMFSIPRLAINWMEGGFDHFFKNRVDFWVTKGYLEPIQSEFFRLPIRSDLGKYVKYASESALDVWGSSGFVALALGLVGLVAMSGRLRRFALACACFMIAVALYRRLPFYPRYFSFLLVGSALAAGLAVSWLLRPGSKARRAALGVALVALAVSVVASYRENAEKLQALERAVADGPYRRFANAIPPGGGVIGTRSVYLNFVSTDVRIFGGQFLTEREYVMFLTWPSERAVIDVMRRHDIEWIFVPTWPWKWVARYNDIWLLPEHGKSARYHQEVRRSPSFCLARRIGSAALYKLDPLGADDAARTRGSRRCAMSGSSAH
jgi:hypothetical protein